MKLEAYVEASAYLRVLEKRLIGTAGLSRVMDAPTAQEALRQISQNSGYDFSALRSPGEYESVLSEGLAAAYNELRGMLPETTALDIPAAKYAFHNMKAALKAHYSQKDASAMFSRIPELSAEDICAFVTDGEATLPDYAALAVTAAREAFEVSRDPQDIDIVLDKHMFGHMLTSCDLLESGLITDYVRESVDYHNVLTLFRVKAMRRGTGFLSRALAEGGKTEAEYFFRHYDKPLDTIAQTFYYRYFGDIVSRGLEGYNRSQTFAQLERLFDNRLMELVRSAKLIAYGPEIPFAYILSKENEVRQIRILMACKLNGIQADALRERLRDNYA